MELDEFKLKLKEQPPEEKDQHSADELELAIRRNTVSITDKIKRNILFELAACGVFVAAAVWAWFTYPQAYARVFSLLTIMLSCLLVVYLAAVYRKINLYETGGLPVRKSLQEAIAILSQFTRVYFQFTMITLPIAFVFGLITGFFSVNGNEAIRHFNWQRALILYTTWFVFWSAVMYFFARWYIKKLYGNHLQQLKEQLKDIENG